MYVSHCVVHIRVLEYNTLHPPAVDSSSCVLVAHFSHWYRSIHTSWSIKHIACCCLVIDVLLHTHASHRRLVRVVMWWLSCIWECTHGWKSQSGFERLCARYLAKSSVVRLADIVYSTIDPAVNWLHLYIQFQQVSWSLKQYIFNGNVLKKNSVLPCCVNRSTLAILSPSGPSHTLLIRLRAACYRFWCMRVHQHL